MNISYSLLTHISTRLNEPHPEADLLVRGRNRVSPGHCIIVGETARSDQHCKLINLASFGDCETTGLINSTSGPNIFVRRIFLIVSSSSDIGGAFL
jgi:hypothetical protein